MSTSFDEFVATIARLRGPDGCPWDREQTHQSLGRYLMEESYEVLEAIHLDDSGKLKEELGDLLLQIVLNAQIAKDNGEFDMFDVADSINQKMISRHPHVFGENKLEHPDQVVAQWEELKEKEKQEADNKNENGNGERRGALDSIPRALPALLQALKVSEKAVGQGFEWKEEEDVWDKLVSEIEDEFDIDAEDAWIRETEDGRCIVNALTPIDEFNEHFNLEFSDEEFDTIGGIVMQHFGRLPERHEAVEIAGLTFKVLAADNRRIRSLKVTPCNRQTSPA